MNFHSTRPSISSRPPCIFCPGRWRRAGALAAVVAWSVFCRPGSSAAPAPAGTTFLPTAALAGKHFGNDAPWYTANVPFLDCSDPVITQVYYYRWALFKSHQKDLGELGYISTEFLGDVGWSIHPFQSLNDATAYHLHEGRWVRNPRYANDYISYMLTNGGDDRHFSDAILDAVHANFLARGDLASATRLLPAMERLYNAWTDHFDAAKGLYWIEPIYDAQEYTISSIDASNGADGFFGGTAFRPSINSFMYANAQAISKLSALNGDAAKAREYAARAAALKGKFQESFWNAGFQHFTDRFQVSNPKATVAKVAYWEFVRGRELAGYSPWYFGLPDDSATYAASWKHLLAPTEFAGRHGLRTLEPSYQFYMKQYRYEGKSPECQWNGPTWPFQTTLVLGGMANLLNDYTQQGPVTADLYVGLLHQYAQQHFIKDTLNLQEDYNPDTGGVIVGLPRSHHYNHSSYPDLVITGLAGLRPRADNILEVNPLIPTGLSLTNPIMYLCLENVPYHGHLVTILYDRDGTRYRAGVGLSVFVDGARVVAPSALGKKTVAIAAPVVPPADAPVDLAVNFARNAFPQPSASKNSTPDALFAALDGRVWYWPEMANYWTNRPSSTPSDWYAVDFGASKSFGSVSLNFYGDGKSFAAPTAIDLQYWTGKDWATVPGQQKQPAKPIANGENTVIFKALATSQLRAVLTNPPSASVALVEFKAYPVPPGAK